MAASPPTSLKRKTSSRDDAPAKKHRTQPVTITLKPKARPFASAPIPMPNACEDYPNGFIYCHQCSKKRDVTDAIQCTFLELIHPARDKDKEPVPNHKEKPPRERRCVGKFCKFCLKNRYDLEFDDLVAKVRAANHEPGHIDSADYIYKCPKCCDICNCPRCRKSKGLEPMGSAGTIRRPPPEPVHKPPKQKAERKSKTKPPADSASAKNGPKAPKKPKAKPLPIVKWSSVPVKLPLEDAEARFDIREFVLRFADLFEPSLPKASLEELDEIGGGRHQGREEDDEMVSWVSEFCVKSIILGLLSLLEKELHGALAASIKHAVKEIRSLGVNLNKIWPILSSLRETSVTLSHTPAESDLFAGLPPSSLPGSPSPNLPFIFAFPDPLPPPTTHDIRAIRSTRHNEANDGLHIAYSAQMVPVITSLIEDALLTSAVREEIENGVREGKETVKEQREAVKREAERWEQVRKGMETHVKLKAQILENRAKREYHKHKLVSLDNSLKVLTPKYAPRFTPLGTDTDSRIYWILSPGVSEREAALDFIMSCSRDEKPAKGKGGKKNVIRKPPKAKVLATEEERREMRSWSWFVAVWGRKPEDAAGSALWKGKGKEKEQQNGVAKSGVKLKIKVKNTLQKSNEVNDGAMDVDDEHHQQQSRHDEDQEMASVSDQETSSPSRSSACASTSTSPSASEDERSDGSQSDQEEDGDEASSESDDEHDGDASPDVSMAESEEEENTEKWWGFYDPFEILKLSDWISIKAGLDSEEFDQDHHRQQQSSSATISKPKELMTTAPLQLPFGSSNNEDADSRASSSTGTTRTFINGDTPGSVTTIPNGHGVGGGKKSRDTSVTIVNDHQHQPSTSTSSLSKNKTQQLKSLVEELRTFASLLEWRIREDKYELILRDPTAASGGSGVASVPGSAAARPLRLFR
ncbi:hypothetical protein D9756_007699 [Leucocoprinus leucothites]|uniref:Zinc-finger domain-containing protein n=1 Tax=Leucocoprinus leucothites TaxID=201217 RepID=A0A8H5FWG8_9AGAR|nr:hypothetical protein D9756_007699 [Leucoagaricus leucothites]